MRSNKKLTAEKRLQTHFPSHVDIAKWIENDVDRESAVRVKRVEDAEIVIQQEHHDMRKAKIAELTARKPAKMLQAMLNAIRDSLSEHASSDDWDDSDHQDYQEDSSEWGKRSEVDELGWVLGSITKM